MFGDVYVPRDGLENDNSLEDGEDDNAPKRDLHTKILYSENGDEENLFMGSLNVTAKPVWDVIMNNARELKGEYSDLVPYWCLPNDFPYTRKIERIVPMYPFSSDMAKYERLKEILAIYRLTLGVSRGKRNSLIQ